MRKISFAVLLLIIVIMVYSNKAKADNIIKIEDGALTFITYDTKATTGTKWRTAGFTITDRKCLGEKGNGGYPAKYKHCKITINRDDIVTEDLGDGRLKSKFYLSESRFSALLNEAGFTDIVKDGGTLYLNCIFQVTKNGKNYGGLHDDLNSIMYAANWKNPYDFYDRFDIKVTYNGTKYPVKVVCRLTDGTVISSAEFPKSEWKKPGEAFAYAYDRYLTYNGEEYEICQSYYERLLKPGKKVDHKLTDYGYSVYDTRNPKGKMVLGGVRITGVYRKVRRSAPGQEEIIYFAGDPKNLQEAVIGSNTRVNELYEVTSGIPSGKQVYVYGNTKRYYFDGQLKKKTETKNYNIEITRNYLLKWKEKKIQNGSQITVSKSRPVSQKKNITVTREVSYWIADDLSVYEVNEFEADNSALGDAVKIKRPESIKSGRYVFARPTKYVIDPEYEKSVVLDTVEIDGGFEEPDVPTFNFMKEAEKQIGKTYVRNDYLMVNGTVVIDNKKCELNGVRPSNIEALENERVMFYKTGITIPAFRNNGRYNSTAAVSYIRKTGTKPAALNVSPGINGLLVFTPVFCDGKVSNNKVQCQRLFPDKTRASIVLDSEFYVRIDDVGMHIDKKGYGYSDYGEFVSRRFVRFPFEVFCDGELIEENTKIELLDNPQKFYMPPWVKTGDYEIEFFNNAYNDRSFDTYMDNANLLPRYYGASDKAKVTVCGRLHNLQIIDVSDYPLWHDVFRDGEDKYKNISYRFGQLDYKLRSVLDDAGFTLPLMNGSHPLISNKGSIKSGYTVRMSVDSMGDYLGEDDYIYITPKFYYVSADGTERCEADVYYNESIETGKERRKYNFIKIGSETDLKNVKKRRLYDFAGYISGKYAQKTAELKSCDLSGYFMKEHALYTFGNILVGSGMNLAVGKDGHEASQQRWYFDYYLPSEIYVVEKDTKTDDGSFITSDDERIKKKGYLLVNFDIELLHNRERELSYINEFNSTNYGYCNMMKTEGMPENKTDNKGNEFEVCYGDVFYITLGKSAGKDYRVFGTH